MKTTSTIALAAVCLAYSGLFHAPAASAWWAKGHENVVDGALTVLPSDFPDFFAKGAPDLRMASLEPDWWANKSLPSLRIAEAPNHYIDLELLKGRELPATREAYCKLCNELNVDPFVVGFLPYSADEWHDRLVLAFAEYRKNPENKLVRSKILYIAGVLSHYTADTTQPLHCTVDHDGKARPDGSSPYTGIHKKMDALLQTRPELPKDLKIIATKDFHATMIAAIMESNSLVGRVYQLEAKLPDPDAAGDAAVAPEVRDLARERFAAAVKLTASAWYSAWIQSKDIEVPDWRVGIEKRN